jgi:hypothetical protein
MRKTLGKLLFSFGLRIGAGRIAEIRVPCMIKAAQTVQFIKTAL